MSQSKRCFLSFDRTCDLTCKAAFEVDDPVDNVDCHFVWLAYHFGESAFELKSMLQAWGHGSQQSPGPGPPAGPGFPPGSGSSSN